MVEPGSVPVLSIGAIIGGSGVAARAWETAVKVLARRVARERAGVSSPLSVNVVYQIPGNNLKPDFAGVRTGRFSKRDRELLVQVALPEESPSDADAQVLARLDESLKLAQEYARRRKLVVDQHFDGLNELLRRLSSSSGDD